MPLVGGEYVWAKGKRIDVADTALAHLAQSVPSEMCLGTWLCQELVGPDPAPGQGARSQHGNTRAPNEAGLGLTPDPDALGEPVSVYG